MPDFLNSAQIDPGTMRKSRLVYFLIVLLFSSQFDEAWIGAPILSSSPVAGDDDEYLPSERRQHSEQSAPHHAPARVERNLPTAGFYSQRRGLASGSDLAVTFGRSQLYVFMSLQC